MAIRPGDVVLCSSTGSGFLSALIGIATGSPFSHAQGVVEVDLGGNPLGMTVLEVGWRIRLAKMRALMPREYLVVRPTMHDGNPISRELGQRVARSWRALVEDLEGDRKSRYPWWKLLAYLLPRRLRGKILIGGPRQVCSVCTIRPLVDEGVAFFSWGRKPVRLWTSDQVEGVTPSDCEENAARLRWLIVARSENAPRIGIGVPRG